MRATIWLLVLASIVLHVCQTAKYSEIDFGTSLNTFADCLVHFLLLRLEGDDKHFTVKPQEFPVVMSVHRHKRYLGRKELKNGGLGIKCNNKVYKQDFKSKKFLFEPQPPEKLGCFVQIFVTPIACSSTSPKFKGISHYSWHFQTIGLIYNDDPENFDNVRKCCVYYIHVEPGVAGTLKKEDFGRIHYINHIPSQYFMTSLHNPSKLIYWIEYTGSRQGFEVSQTVVLTCSNSQFLRTEGYKYCKRTTQSNLRKCIGDFAKKYKSIHSVSYNRLIENRHTVNLLRQICPIRVLVYNRRGNKLDGPVNGYLTQWTLAGAGVEPVIWGILVPNSSIVGFSAQTVGRSIIINILNMLSINPTPMSMRYDSVEFITCVPLSKKPFLSLAGYVSAFDCATWLFIAVLLFFSIVVLQSVERKGKKYIGFALTLFYSILIAQGTSSVNRARLLSGTWILAGLFLTYNYQGSNIDQLTAPLEPKKLDTFEEMFRQNLTVFSTTLDFEHAQVFTEVYNSGERNWTIRWWSAIDVTLAPLYMRKHINDSITEAETALRRFIKVPVHETETVSMLYIEYYIDKISKCQSEVFVDKMVHVNTLRSGLRKLQIGGARIATSKSSYGIYYQNWIFNEMELPEQWFETRYLSLIHSGLVHLWNDWKFRIDTWNETMESAKVELGTSKAISTKDNIVVVFYLHLFLLLISNVIFVCEFRKPVVHVIHSLARLTVTVVKACGSGCKAIFNFRTLLDSRPSCFKSKK